MEIILLGRQQEDGPAYVDVKFPISGGPVHGPERSSMKNPRCAWKSLAEEKAHALGVEMAIQYTDEGLIAAFYTQEDCSHVLKAMEPEWPDRLMDGLAYWVKANYLHSGDPMHHIEEMARDYGLDVDAVAALYTPRSDTVQEFGFEI